MTHGDWEIDTAVADRWHADGLDDVFRAEWEDPEDTRFEPLNDSEARPNTPKPYCVYERFPSVSEGHSGGKEAGTELQYYRVVVQFTIHAKSTSTESGKAIATRFAGYVADAFNPGRPLSLCDGNRWTSTTRESGWQVHEGDQEWAVGLQFTVRYEAEYTPG